MADTETPTPEMSEPLSFRFPRPLLEKVDAYAKELGAKLGIRVPRSQAVTSLLEAGLKEKSRKR